MYTSLQYCKLKLSRKFFIKRNCQNSAKNEIITFAFIYYSMIVKLLASVDCFWLIIASQNLGRERQKQISRNDHHFLLQIDRFYTKSVSLPM